MEGGRNNSSLASKGHPSMTVAVPAVSLLEAAAPLRGGQGRGRGLWRLCKPGLSCCPAFSTKNANAA